MIGDTTLIYGKKYKLNQLPQITKNGERNYTYELTLEGAQYDLIDVQYHLPEDCYGDTFYSDLVQCSCNAAKQFFSVAVKFVYSVSLG